MNVEQGIRLGHYTIISPLGAGGMGEAWLAEDTTLKRKVALKVLSAGVPTNPDHLARFQREAEAVAYMSPERAQGKPVDSRSDIFSLGVILDQRATGDRLIRNRKGRASIDRMPFSTYAS